MSRWLACCAALFVLLAGSATAHEVRPAYLEIDQVQATTYRVVWKLPARGEAVLRLVPQMSNGWLDREPSDQYAAGDFLIRTWTIEAAPQDTLAGATLAIDGLKSTITDVLVRIRWLDGRSIETILRPQAAELTIPAELGRHIAVPAFLLLGVEHILAGPDHLLFVLGLLLIVRGRWRLLATVTAFTVAHSLTLAAAVLGKITCPPAFVESLIAVSILFLAPEILRARRGGDSLTIRYPWAVAFVFGLFHGMGFADALLSLAFDPQEMFAALLLFNVGVELGQLAFIGLVVLAGHALRRVQVWQRIPQATMPAYVVGIAGAYWTFENSAAWLLP